MDDSLNGLVEIAGVSSTFSGFSKSFKQIQLQDNVDIPMSCPGIGQILRVAANVKILRADMIPTPRSISYEGQILTGLKLIVEGRIEQSIEYIADDENQQLHMANFTDCFGTYIILDKSFTSESEILVTPYIEDIFVKKINDKRVYRYVMLLLDAAPSGSIS